MKRILSVLIAAIMAASVLTVAAVPAMASVSSPAPVVIDDNAKPTVEVNGQTTTTDVTYSPDENDSNTITFTYVGDGEVTGWEDNLEELGLVPGTDFTAVINPDKSYTIQFISDAAKTAYNEGRVVVNAIVKNAETPTQPANKDDSKKSPKTGFSTAVVAASFAAAGAGFAVLSSKKKDEVE